MFKPSEFLDEESLQAARLAESLDKVSIGAQTDVDYREDPELSELLAVGQAIRAAADEATTTPSFKSFHLRSRAAILHTTGMTREREEPLSVVDRFIHAVLPIRTIAFSGLVGSVATMLIVVVAMGNGDTPVNQVQLKDSLNDTTREITATSSSTLHLKVTAVGSDVREPEQVQQINSVIGENATNGSLTVAAIAVQNDENGLVLQMLQDATSALRAARDAGTVTVDDLHAVTDNLAHIGHELRTNHPGARNSQDVEDFQNSIVDSLMIINSIEQTDPRLAASLIAAKIVAEDTMGIATRYVLSNQASR